MELPVREPGWLSALSRRSARNTPLARLTSIAPWLWSCALVFALWHGGMRNRQDAHFGDDPEYLTMTMSIVRHLSPEFVPGDDFAMLRGLPPHWRRTLAHKFHLAGVPAGYFRDEHDRYYSFHFFTYPLVAFPLRKWLDGKPQAARAHQLTNLAWLSFAMLSLLQLRAQRRLFWSMSSLAFLTPVLWFTTYAHTESFVYACGIIALGCYLRDRLVLAIWFNSLAATQYQPLALLSFGVGAQWLWQHRHSVLRHDWPRLILVILGCALVFAPSLFYYLHFGVPNLIVRDGMARPGFMSAAKFGWMFVDPNGGMLAYTPGLLLLLLAAAGWSVQRAWRERSYWGIVLLGCVLAGFLGSTVQRNWNHPTFGISRYVLYGLAPILLFVGNELRRYKGRTSTLVACVVAALALQLVVHRAFGFMRYTGNDSAHHSPFASYVLERWPALYSPPDETFCERTSRKCLTDGRNALSESLPIVWRDQGGRAHKILAQRCAEQPLRQAAPWSSEEWARIQAALRECEGSGTFYINL
jgi:hypothetical protein